MVFFFSWAHFTLLAIPGSWEWAVDSTGIFPPRSVSFLRALCVLRVCCCLISLAWVSWLLRWPCLAHSCCSLVQQVNSPRVLASQTHLCLALSLSLPCYASQTLIPNLCSRLRRNFPKKGRFDPSKCNENREVGSQDYFSLLKIYLTFLHITLKGDIVEIMFTWCQEVPWKVSFLLIHGLWCPHFTDNHCYWVLFFTCSFRNIICI